MKDVESNYNDEFNIDWKSIELPTSLDHLFFQSETFALIRYGIVLNYYLDNKVFIDQGSVYEVSQHENVGRIMLAIFELIELYGSKLFSDDFYIDPKINMAKFFEILNIKGGYDPIINEFVQTNSNAQFGIEPIFFYKELSEADLNDPLLPQGAFFMQPIKLNPKSEIWSLIKYFIQN